MGTDLLCLRRLQSACNMTDAGRHMRPITTCLIGVIPEDFSPFCLLVCLPPHPRVTWPLVNRFFDQLVLFSARVSVFILWTECINTVHFN